MREDFYSVSMGSEYLAGLNWERTGRVPIELINWRRAIALCPELWNEKGGKRLGKTEPSWELCYSYRTWEGLSYYVKMLLEGNVDL